MFRYLVRFGAAALRHPRIALLGYREGWGDSGMTYDDDPSSNRSVAYDVGRTIRRRDYEKGAKMIDGVSTSDTAALNEIADLLDGNEWDADTVMAVVTLVRQTGRTIHDSEEYA